VRLADTETIAWMLMRPKATIRSWAYRGHFHRHGTGPRGTALYDVDEVLAFATRHGLLDNRPASSNTQLPAGPVCP
jgi:hypothetical protein